MFSVTNDQGVTFNVIVVQTGERWGLNKCLVNDGEPLVEFYDSRNTGEGFTPIGQFVTNYAISTFLEDRDDNRGLILWGTEPSWRITAKNVRQVIEYLKNR